MKQVELIQTNLNDFLLRDIIFFIKNDRVVKKGKLILFKFKEFHFLIQLLKFIVTYCRFIYLHFLMLFLPLESFFHLEIY